MTRETEDLCIVTVYLQPSFISFLQIQSCLARVHKPAKEQAELIIVVEMFEY